MNLKDENKKLKETIKSYESYYGNHLALLCLLCTKPIDTKNKISVINKKEFTSKTIGHFHPKCWEKIGNKDVGTKQNI